MCKNIEIAGSKNGSVDFTLIFCCIHKYLKDAGKGWNETPYFSEDVHGNSWK